MDGLEFTDNTMIVDQDDIAYFRNKVARATNPEAKKLYEKQLAMVEDAVVIYRCIRLPRKTI